jgi:hypothetical protein
MLLSYQAMGLETELVVKARGSKANGVYSHFRLIVNDMDCGSKHVHIDFDDYAFTIPFSRSEIKKVQIVFDNDWYSMGEDRNLCVKSIVIDDDIPMRAGRESVEYICANGERHPYCGMMEWNGTLTFDVENLQFHPGDKTLTSQEEVNEFTAEYVQGNLRVSGNDIVDLTPLSQLVSVKRSLIIENNPNLTNIAGLNVLMEVGFIKIENNPKLKSIDAFSQLEKCGGMYIRDNNLLKTIKCFNSPSI